MVSQTYDVEVLREKLTRSTPSCDLAGGSISPRSSVSTKSSKRSDDAMDLCSLGARHFGSIRHTCSARASGVADVIFSH